MVQALAIDGLASVDYSKYGNYLLLSDSGILRRIHFVKRNMRWRFKFLRDRFRNPVVLDFGSGAGYFCKAAEESGLNVYGIELSDKLIEFSKTKVKFHKIFKSLDEVKVKLDAVFMSDVIEHLHPEISREVMQKVIALLKPEGYLIGNTPNFRSLNILLCKDRDPVVAPPSHVGYFTPMSLDRYLLSMGLKRTQLYSNGLSSNSFFRKSKFERSFLEKGLREARLYEVPFIIAFRIAFGLAGVLVRPFGIGYQIHFIYQKT